MAIAKMTKVLIVSHRSEAAELLEEIQKSSILEVLDAERANVSKQWPELMVESKKPKDIEDLAEKLEKNIKFLEAYRKEKKSLLDALAPRTVIEDRQYTQIVSSEQVFSLLKQAEKTAANIQQLETQKEKSIHLLEMLKPWKSLKTPLEELTDSERTRCFIGMIADKNLENLKEQLNQKDAALQTAGQDKALYACLVICLKENAAEVQKILRSVEFSAVSFEKMTGTAAQIIQQQTERLGEIRKAFSKEKKKATELAGEQLKLKILFDHYQNLLTREQTRAQAPITSHTVLLEGWVKEKDYPVLKSIVSQFPASTIGKINPAEEEEIPVEIENKPIVKPFEVITRLYGMPEHLNVDPTVFLAPFFALFFGICLTDAGYGFVMAVILWWLIKKIQGDKKAFNMLIICSVMSVIAGILTGGWFSDTIQTLLPAHTTVGKSLNAMRENLMLFDPMQQPLIFFGISLFLGYVQVLFGIIVAFVHNIRRKEYAAAFCDQLTWLIFLNCLLLFAFSRIGYLPKSLSGLFIVLAVIQAVVILLFSERQGGWGGRIGMGAFQLFSTVFYFGDILSYVRLMALGMVTGGFGMAANVIVKLLMDLGWVGWILGAVVFILLHTVNLALSALSAFVHTLRLQYVEFFPKFFTGGGREFWPLRKKNKYVIVRD